MSDKLKGKFELGFPLDISKCYAKSKAEVEYQLLYNMLFAEETANRTSYDALKIPFYVKDYPCPAEILIQHREYFRNELKILAPIFFYVKSYFYSYLSKQNYYKPHMILVSVHIRRTDYFRHMQVLYNRTVLSTCYYINALNYFREKFNNQVLFFVFSDDIPWCKVFLDFPDVVFPDADRHDEPLFDFILISFCDHHIIGLGTFGFLSAFYGQGTIMFPVVDTKTPSELEISYSCSNSDVFIPMMDEPLTGF